MAIELATAYVSLVPSAQGLRKAIADELKSAGAGAGAAGDQAGEQFGAGFVGKAKLAMAGAGLAIGGLLVKGTMDAIDRQAASAQLAAQLGLTPDEAARVGGVAGDVWANNFGENIGQVNEAIAAIDTNLGDLADIPTGDLQGMAQDALTLSSVLGEDVSRSVRGVGQLLTNNLAGDGQEAFDLITAAAQRLPQEMRGELIDTIEEYSNQFADFGLTAEDALGLVVAGVQGGARSVDGAADAFKEFGLNVTAGTVPAAEAISTLGLDIGDLQAMINNDQGGAAFAAVFDALTGLEDQTEAARLAQDLLGGSYEQVGLQGLAAMSDFEGALGDVEGATGDAADALGGTFAARLESLKRKGLDALVQAGERVLPVLEGIVGFTERLITTFGEEGLVGVLRPAGEFISEHAELFAIFGGILGGIAAAVLAALIPAFIAWAVAAGAAAIATIAAAAPIIAIGAAIGLLAAAVIWAYQNWDFFRTAVDAVAGFLKDDLWPILQTVAGFITGQLVPAVAEVVGWFAGRLQESLSNVVEKFSALWNAGIEMKDQLVTAFDQIVEFVSGLPGRLADAGRGIWDFLTAPFEAAMNAIRDLWNNTIGGFSFEVPDWIPGVGGSGWTIPTLHTGGIVPGRPGQEVLAMLQAGEQVISIADVRAMRSVDPATAGGGRGDINIDTVNTGGRPLLEQLVELRHLAPV